MTDLNLIDTKCGVTLQKLAKNMIFKHILVIFMTAILFN